MGAEQFKVFFTGQLIDGATHKKVAIRFAQTFKVPIDKAYQIVSAPKQVLLKSSLSHAKAYQMKLVLERLGMQVWLQRMKCIGTQRAVTSEKPPTQKPPTQKPPTQKEHKAIPTETSNWSLEPLDDEIRQKNAEGVELQNLSQVVGKDIKK
ncbi:hypothetical protein [Marinicella sp. W31]|uniref:hypothetical protein n=1 Tax=Marinicella sp. W31 TaxID=3023713 RepID=UPI003756807D